MIQEPISNIGAILGEPVDEITAEHARIVAAQQAAQGFMSPVQMVRRPSLRATVLLPESSEVGRVSQPTQLLERPVQQFTGFITEPLVSAQQTLVSMPPRAERQRETVVFVLTLLLLLGILGGMGSGYLLSLLHLG